MTKEIEIKHVPTEDIPEDMKYKVHCSRCGRITIASHEPIPDMLAALTKAVPCSKCVKPEDYLKGLRNE